MRGNVEGYTGEIMSNNLSPEEQAKSKRLKTLYRRLRQWERERKLGGPNGDIAPRAIEMITSEIARAEHRHIESSKCWCLPTLDFAAENGNEVWVHHEPN